MEPFIHSLFLSFFSCLQEECGEWVTALCPYGENGCPDSEGDHDIVMREPEMGTSGMMYKVRLV